MTKRRRSEASLSNTKSPPRAKKVKQATSPATKTKFATLESLFAKSPLQTNNNITNITCSQPDSSQSLPKSCNSSTVSEHTDASPNERNSNDGNKVESKTTISDLTTTTSSDVSAAVPEQTLTQPPKKVHPFFTQSFKKPKAKKPKLNLKDEGTVKLEDMSPDTIVNSICDIFMTNEQKKRKRELKNIASFKENLEKSKELNSLFCKPFTGDISQHPLLAPKQQTGRKQKTAIDRDSSSDYDLEFQPLTNVSKSKIWTHGPPVHVYQEDALLSSVDSTQYQCSNTLVPIDSNLITTTDDTDCQEAVERDIEHSITENRDHWWRDYINSYQTKIRKEEVSHHSAVHTQQTIILPIECNDSSIKSVHEQYLNFMRTKLERSADRIPGLQVPHILRLFEKLCNRRVPIQSNSSHLILNNAEQWTFKYRPLSRDEIVDSNADVINELWSWMKDWEQFRESLKQQSKQKKARATSKKKAANLLFYDENEYEQSDDSDSEDEFDPMSNNLIMISGDVASGKSAAICACAHQLGFHIFEINSSSERSQATILKHTEATQSHQIHRFLTNKQVESDSDSKLQSSSLMLFEEVDNLFEPDKNFFAGVKKIQKTTKRPLILTSNKKLDIEDLNMCKHMEFTNLGLGLTANDSHIRENVLKKSSLLYLILLCEGVEMKVNGELAELIIHFCGDLRKAMLNLQFWVQDSSLLPCFMDEILGDRPVDMRVKSDRHALEKCLGLYTMSNHLFNLDEFSDLNIQSVLLDELSTARENDYDVMFSNYLDTATSAASDNKDNSFLDELDAIATYADTLSQCDYQFRRRDGEVQLDDISADIYGTTEILNHKSFLHRYPIRKKREMQPNNTHNILSSTLETSSRLKITNPLYFKQAMVHKSELLELIRKAVSPAMSLSLCSHPDLLYHILALCLMEDCKRDRRTSRRFYHHLQHIYHADHLSQLNVVGRRCQQLFCNT